MFVCIEAERQSHHVFSHVWTELPFPGYLVVLWVVNVPNTRTQHGVVSADRTHDLLIRSLMQYNYAIAIPTHRLIKFFRFNMMKKKASTFL